MTCDYLALLADARLPGDARIMALIILVMGNGWHEVTHDQFRAFLPYGPSDETIRRHLRHLEGSGWLETKTNTGRRPPQYRVRLRAEAGPFGGVRDALLASIIPLLPPTDVGQTSSMPPTPEGQNPLPHSPVGQRHSTPLPSGAEAPTTTAAIKEDGCCYSLDPKAAEIVSGDLFRGCRGALRDYLKLRVATEVQPGYVQRLAMVLNGADQSWWRNRKGDGIPEKRRTSMLAMALNELAGGTEVGEHYRDRPGNIGNLRTKVRHEVQIELGQSADKERGNERGNQAGGDPRKGGGEAGGAGGVTRKRTFRRG